MYFDYCGRCIDLFYSIYHQGVYLLGNEGKDGIQPLSSLWREAPEDWECCGLSGNGVVHLPYSSGTTGLPKGVELTSANWLATLATVG